MQSPPKDVPHVLSVSAAARRRKVPIACSPAARSPLPRACSPAARTCRHVDTTIRAGTARHEPSHDLHLAHDQRSHTCEVRRDDRATSRLGPLSTCAE